MERFVLKFLWLDKFIAVSLDQKLDTFTIPLTEYLFWPKNDAWEDMRIFLSNCSWISQTEAIIILNQVTEVINFWQEKADLDKSRLPYILRDKFPSCYFQGF